MDPTPSQLLAAALAADGSRPFVTFYDEITGERIELSVATFTNWVAKTANLIVDGLGLGPGDVLRLDLPRHWQAPLWAVAAWSAGLTVDLSGDPAAAALAVCGPAGIDTALAAPDVIALSLRPLGAPFAPGSLPAGVLDYGREVGGYADEFRGPAGFDADVPLIVDRAESRTNEQAIRQAVGHATAWGLDEGGRLLVDEALDPVDEVLATTLVPLVRAGSAVLVKDAGPDRIEAIAAAERVTARAVGHNG